MWHYNHSYDRICQVNMLLIILFVLFMAMSAESQDNIWYGHANLSYKLDSLGDQPPKYVGVYVFPNKTLIMIRSTNNTYLALDKKYGICYSDNNIDMIFSPIAYEGILHYMTPPVMSRSFTPVENGDPIESDPVLSNVDWWRFGKSIRDEVKTSREQPFVRYHIEKNNVKPFHVILVCKKETDIYRIWRSRFLYFDELEYKSFFTISTQILNYIGVDFEKKYIND